MAGITVKELRDLLANWTYLFTFGSTGDVYACGNKRKMIGRTTGQVITKYTVKELICQTS